MKTPFKELNPLALKFIVSDLKHIEFEEVDVEVFNKASIGWGNRTATSMESRRIGTVALG